MPCVCVFAALARPPPAASSLLPTWFFPNVCGERRVLELLSLLLPSGLPPPRHAAGGDQGLQQLGSSLGVRSLASPLSRRAERGGGAVLWRWRHP
jgi:hypothetical protein